MSKKIEFLQRWMFIINKISSHPYITRTELERAMEEELPLYDGASGVVITTRTLERDIHDIRNAPFMDISIEYCKTRKGYYIPADEKSLSKLERLFELSSLLSFNSLKGIVFTENRKSSGLEHRTQLVKAIHDRREIVIQYGRYQEPSTEKERVLRPYALREFKNRWYLIAAKTVNCKSGKEEKITIWGLDRIKKLTMTQSTFKRDPRVDPERVFEHSFGIFINEDIEPETVILSFSPLNGKYIQSCPLHKSQKVLIDNEEEFRVELKIKITSDFVMELLSQTEGLNVIAPLHLKERMISIYENAITKMRTEN